MSTPALLEIVKTRIAGALPVRRTLAGGGRLHIDRPVPFLCVYRTPDVADVGTGDLVRTQASYLVAPAGDPALALLEAAVGALTDACGACLVLDVSAGDDGAGPFRIRVTEADREATTVSALASALAAMPGSPAVQIETAVQPLVALPGVLSIGLEVPPSYRAGSVLYPSSHRAVVHELAHVFQRTFFEFTRVQTSGRPTHFHMMGRRRLVRAVRLSDQALSQIDESFDFLLAITPTNTDAAWEEFQASKFRTTPAFRYRMLAIDPDEIKRRIYDLPLERLEDPVLAELLRDKRRELDRRVSMLDARDTPRFRYASLQLYGPVEDPLFGAAETILATLAATPPGRETDARRVDAATFAGLARAELAAYRETLPDLAATVEIRDDVASLLVSNGNLLVPARLSVTASRVDALLQHEVGTHAVTYANGARQPLRVLGTGLAGYEALQEGLAMFAEYLAGALDADRLRLVAARVVAVRRLVEDVAFPDVVEELIGRCAMSPRTAFGVAVRVFRGGGLTKDAIYLRGLLGVLDFLARGGDLESLVIGKLAFEQVELVEELVRREILHPPALRPRWLDAPASLPRITRARTRMSPLDLVEVSP